VNNTTRTLTVLSVRPQVSDVDVSNAPINQSDTTQSQTVTVHFDRPMNTSVDAAVRLENLTASVSYGSGSWVNDTAYQQEVDISDADEEATAQVNVSDATDTTGDVMSPDNSTTVVVDTTVPAVSVFEVTNPYDYTVAVNFTASEKLDEVLAVLKDNQGDVVKRFTSDEFTISQTAGGNYIYNGTYVARQTSTYNGTLRTAQDTVDNDGANNQSDTVKITGGGSTKPLVRNFSDITASINGDHVNVGNITVEDTESNEDIDTITVEVRKAGNTTLLGSTTIDRGSESVVTELDVRVSAVIEQNTVYNVTLIANDTSGNSISLSENVTSEYTDTIPPTIDGYGDVTYKPGANEVTVKLVNVSDNDGLDRVEFTVTESGSTVATKTVSASSTNDNLTSVVISAQVEQSKDYNVTAEVFDDAGNRVNQTKQANLSSEPTIKNFTGILASYNEDYVEVDNVTVTDPDGVDSVTVEVRKQDGTLLNDTTFTGGSSTKNLSKTDITLAATIDKDTTYDVVVIGKDTNGNTVKETKEITSEETDLPPVIDVYSNVTADSTTNNVTVGTLNASDDSAIDKVVFTVYDKNDNKIGSKTIPVNSATTNLSSVTITTSGIQPNKNYTVEAAVYDDAGNKATKNETATT